MLITLAIWVVVAGLAGVIGAGYFSMTSGSSPAERLVVNLWLGAGILSNGWLTVALWLPLSPVTAILTAAVLLGVIIQTKPFRLRVATLGRDLAPDAWTLALAVGLASIVAAVVAVAPVTLIDTGIYHYPAARWLAEYGVVKGTALLDVQLGYASSWFALFAPCLHGGMKTRAAALGSGLALALWLSSAGFAGLRIYRGDGQPTDWFLVWATVLGVGAVSTLDGLLASSSPDVPTAALIITIAWVLLGQRPAAEPRSGWTAAALAAVALSIKLTAAPVLVVAGWLAWRASGWKWKTALSLAVMVIGLLLPVTVVRAMASGHPFFPSKLCALPVAWRYDMNPWQMADGTPRELTVAIRDQARWDWGALASPRYSQGPLDGLLDWRWLPAWPSHEPVAAGLLAASVVATLAMLLGRRQSVVGWGWVLGLGWFGSAYVLLQAPSLRFGVGYFVIPPALGLAYFSTHLPRWVPALLGAGLVTLLPFPASVPLWRPPRLTPTPVSIQQVNGMRLYQPVPQPGIFPRCGDSPLPCGSNIAPTVRLRDPRRGVAAGFIRGRPSGRE
ncbi:MAG: hypothetical protein SNJ67_00325 [Chloracidobacterium sp.]|uniref:DUF8201 domain-containing protein n=1 Tax=Chloracidobacterium validum TaxID=2821543 RepID=A0ABX8B996_9BACT|nr:hypothetical protein [Chloracidobacterium validum]QUW02120.1 hypothetical protein J8C06_07025 [Chloracidobacterium validum]